MIQQLQAATDAIASKEAADGAISVEYVLIAAFVVLMVALVVAALSPAMKGAIDNTAAQITNTLNTATTNSKPAGA